MEALEKSTGKTSKELLKMMKDGQLGEEYILPFVKAMQDLAEANGAYEKALKKLGTVENRLKATSGFAAVRIAEAGFTKGLVNLYETLMKSMNENGVTLERIGKIYEKVFNAIAVVVRVASHWIEVFIRSIESVYLAVKNNPFTTMLVAATAFAGVLKSLPALLLTVGKFVVAAFSKPLAMLTMLMGLIDEVRAIFDANVIGLGENEKASQEDRDIAAASYRRSIGAATAEDNKLLSSLSASRIQQAKASSGGIGSYLFGSAEDPVARGERIRQALPKTSGFMDGYLNMLKSPANLFSSAKDLMFSQTIIVQGNMSDENARQISEETRKAMEMYSTMNTVSSR